ncbi:endo-1,4-beta-xylanase [Rhizobiaceae bacterium]|nr:endo-1,4-beta-xylanase [Rhizobiaceae bacterium]
MAGSAGLAAAYMLPARAAGRVPYGVAVELPPFRDVPAMKELLAAHADLVVPMNALKWASLRYDRDKFDFSGADEIIDFAKANGRAIHGHALLWYAFNPAWLDGIVSGRELERVLDEHIDTVVSRYAGTIASWDVVNEAVAHDPLTQGKWRAGVWYDVLGPAHVEKAFSRAAKADPSARLAFNDYDLEDDSPRTKARQDAVLDIVRRLQDRNVPIHQIGMQAHLYGERKIGHDNLRKFLRALKSLGVDVSVTELDVIDWRMPADATERDTLAAGLVDDYLGTVFSELTPRSVTTWGLADPTSWIGETFPRKDSALARPLPFDADWQPKAMFDVIRRYTGAA